MRNTMMRVGIVLCGIAVSVIGVLGMGYASRKTDRGSSLRIQRIEKVLNGGARVAFDGYYKDGRAVEHGQCVVVFQDGPRCEISYSHGVANGPCKWYYQDGSLAFEGTYRMGKPWDGIVIPIGMCMGLPHRYGSGKDEGVWTDPKGVFVDE